MDKKEHTEYLKEFKAYSKEVTSTKEASQKFLIRTGINTPKGRLSKAYSSGGTTSKKLK